MTGKLMAHAFGGALAALVLGVCGGRILLIHLDSVDAGGVVVAGVALLFVLWQAHRAMKPFAGSEAARKSARQFLWSCVFFAMISMTFGLGVSAVIWRPSGFNTGFGFVFWGLLTCVAIFPVRRDARRFENAGRG